MVFVAVKPSRGSELLKRSVNIFWVRVRVRVRVRYESARSPLFTNGKLSLKKTMDVSTPCSIMIELFYFFKHRQHQQ